LDREESLVDNVAEPIDNARAVEVEPRRSFVLERIEDSTLSEDVERLSVRVPPDGLEQRMPWRYPLDVVRFGFVSVGRAARVLVRKRRKLPVLVLLVAPESGRCPRGFEAVREFRD